MSDILFQRIENGLTTLTDSVAFERWAVELLSQFFPSLVPVRGGQDGGMDGHGSDSERPFLLVATTGENAIRNLTSNLESHRSSGGAARNVVFATTTTLTGRRQANLVARAQSLGYQLDEGRIYDGAAFAAFLYRRPDARRALLNIADPIPALSQISPRQRLGLGFDQDLVGREGAFSALSSIQGDVIVVGKPGIGKTAVLERMCRQGWGHFDTGASRDALFDAVLGIGPERVICDDVHLDIERLDTLEIVRRQGALSFDIVASCWPGAIERVRVALPAATIVPIDELPKDQILEIVEGVGIAGPRELQALIVSQALGRPGIATLLATAALNGRTIDVAKGDVLFEQVVSFYRRSTGDAAASLLGAFSLSWDRGLSLSEAAAMVALSEVEVQALARSLAQGGVLDEADLYGRGTGRLTVQPRDLRFALIRDVFTGAAALDSAMMIEKMPDAREAILPLAGAIHRGADRLESLVQSLVDAKISDEQASAVATLGGWGLDLVLERAPQRAQAAATAALEHSPGKAALVLAGLSVGDGRPRHSNPDHPMRELADFLTGSRGGIASRSTALNALVGWMDEGGDPDVALEGIAACLDPRFQEHLPDPGLGNTITLVQRPGDPSFIEELLPLWERVIPRLGSHNFSTYEPILSVLHSMTFPSIMAIGGQNISPQVSEAYTTATISVVVRLLDELKARPGIISRLRMFIVEGELGIPVPSESEWDILFPGHWGEPLEGDHDAWLASITAAAHRLADSWLDRTPMELSSFLEWYEREARTVEASWPRLTPAFCERLAFVRPEEASAFVGAFLRAGLPADLVMPFLIRLERDRPPHWQDALRDAMDSEIARPVAIQLCLTSDVGSELRGEALSLLDGRYRVLVEVLVLRGVADDQTVHRLLNHPDRELAQAAAGHLSSDQVEAMSEDARAAWERVVTRGTPSDYWIRRTLERDTRLLVAWLENWLGTDDEPFASTHFLPDELLHAVSQLPESSRASLVERIPPDRLTLWMSPVVAALVGNQASVAAVLLGRSDLAAHHGAALQGDMDQGWLEISRLALRHGWSPSEVVAHSVMKMMLHTGEESCMWQRHIDTLNGLDADDDIGRSIVAAGVEYFTKWRDEALARERHEAVFG